MVFQLGLSCMKFVHLVHDMQSMEGENFLPENWSALGRGQCQLREDLDRLGVVTIHVGMGPISTPVLPYRDVKDLVLRKTAVDLDASYRYGFEIDVRHHHLVAMKDQYSSLTSHMEIFLGKEGADFLIMNGVWEGEFLDEKGRLIKPDDKRVQSKCLTASMLHALQKYSVIVVSDLTNYDHDHRRGALPDRLSEEARRDAYEKAGVLFMTRDEVVAFVESYQLEPEFPADFHPRLQRAAAEQAVRINSAG